MVSYARGFLIAFVDVLPDGSAGYSAYSAGDPRASDSLRSSFSSHTPLIPFVTDYNREMRVIEIQDYGNTAYSYKVIDDIFQGTVHRNMSEPIVTLF